MRAMALLRPPRGRRRTHPPEPGRPRDPGVPASPEEREALDKPGFTEEALPWMNAVYRFSLRLTRDESDAEDLVQETYLRAYRAWGHFERGTNCRPWLFTICRNAYLRARDRASVKREVTESDLASEGPEHRRDRGVDQLATASGSPDDFFDRIVDDRLVAALDTLTDEFHDVLVLSDLADLTYREITEVLDVPVGTVKSRLFRARRQMRDKLTELGMEPSHE